MVTPQVNESTYAQAFCLCMEPLFFSPLFLALARTSACNWAGAL